MDICNHWQQWARCCWLNRKVASHLPIIVLSNSALFLKPIFNNARGAKMSCSATPKLWAETINFTGIGATTGPPREDEIHALTCKCAPLTVLGLADLWENEEPESRRGECVGRSKGQYHPDWPIYLREGFHKICNGKNFKGRKSDARSVNPTSLSSN